MARRGGGSASFPKWATPMVEKKKHRTDPFMDPDNAIAYPKAPNTMGFPIPNKTAGYKIGTGGVRSVDKWHKDGSHQ